MNRLYGLWCTNFALFVCILLPILAQSVPVGSGDISLGSGNPCSAARHAKLQGITCEELGEETGLLFAISLLRCRTPEKWKRRCKILRIEDISKCVKDEKSMDVLNLIWIPYVDISRYCYKQGAYGTVKRMLKVVEKGLKESYPNYSVEVPLMISTGSSTSAGLFLAYLLAIFLGLKTFRNPPLRQLILELAVHAVAFYAIGRFSSNLRMKKALWAVLFLTFLSTIPYQIYQRKRIAREREEKRR